MKKKFLRILTLAAVAAIAAATLAACTGGTGEATPVQKSIATAEEFLSIENYTGAQFAGSVFTLTEDLDFTGKAFRPVGTIASPFTGKIDGDGHKITGISFLNEEILPETVGIVGASLNAEFCNLTIEMKVMQKINKKGSYLGAVVGAAWGTLAVDNVTAKFETNNRYETYEEINASTDVMEKKTDAVEYVGGIVGYVNGHYTITDSTVDLMAEESSVEYNNASQELPRVACYLGGIIGYGAGDGKINNAAVTLHSFSATAKTLYAGGIAGHAVGAEITDSTVTYENGNAVLRAAGTSGKGAAGGIVGYGNRLKIANVSFTAAAGTNIVIESDYLGITSFNFGGIAGYLDNSTLRTATATFRTTVTSGSFFGGIAGVVRASTVDGVTVTGDGFIFKLNDFNYLDENQVQKSYLTNGSMQISAFVGVVKGATSVKNCNADIAANTVFGAAVIEQDVDDDGNPTGDVRTPSVGEANTANQDKLNPKPTPPPIS